MMFIDICVRLAITCVFTHLGIYLGDGNESILFMLLCVSFALTFTLAQMMRRREAIWELFLHGFNQRVVLH